MLLTQADLMRCRSMHYQPTLQKNLPYGFIASGLDGKFLLCRAHVKLIIRTRSTIAPNRCLASACIASEKSKSVIRKPGTSRHQTSHPEF
jgi:hypothetical protein